MTNEFDGMDFFHDDRLVADPYPYLDAMRGACPVRQEPHQGVYLITGFDEAVEVFQDPGTWSSCLSVTGPFPGFPVPVEGTQDDIGALIEEHRDKLPMSDQLPTMDPPTHTAHRALMMKLITPKRLRENQEAMTQVADTLLEEHLAPGTGEFVHGFAGVFSLMIIADLLGVPEEDRSKFVAALTRRKRAGLGEIGGELPLNPMEYLYTTFTAYVTERRRDPRQDVLTGLATATFPDGSTPEVIDVVRVAANVFSAGQETTVRLLSTALLMIADRPDIQRALRRDRSLVPNFIEECLRAESPIKGDFRFARCPAEVGGVDLPTGSVVMVLNGAANRDPGHFENPASFDIERRNARHHIAFGRGIHTCPGASLARAEARACIERILDKTTDIRISEREHGPAGDRRFQYMPTYILRGLTALHLEYDLR